MTERSDADAQPAPDSDPDTAPEPEPAWVRKRRLERIFGDVLPDTTSDERDERGERGQSSEDWLKAQVPPHHGG